MTQTRNAGHFLMCPPEHFAVTYSINPWMEPERWSRKNFLLSAAARREWENLHDTLVEHGAMIDLVEPVPGIPDLVFTANAAIVLDRMALLARFRHAERQGEEPHFEAAFKALQARGLIDDVRTLPTGLSLEGAGDCVFDAARRLFWMGYGSRSDFSAREAVEHTFGVEVAALELADPRFYHMDTALSALPRGEVMYLPGAFTAAGLAEIRARVAKEQRIEITLEEASALSANAVCLGDTLVMAGCSERLRRELARRDYRVRKTPLGAFLRSGGAAFCLTLRLDRGTRVTSHAIEAAAVA